MLLHIAEQLGRERGFLSFHIGAVVSAVAHSVVPWVSAQTRSRPSRADPFGERAAALCQDPGMQVGQQEISRFSKQLGHQVSTVAGNPPTKWRFIVTIAAKFMKL